MLRRLGEFVTDYPMVIAALLVVGPIIVYVAYVIWSALRNI